MYRALYRRRICHFHWCHGAGILLNQMTRRLGYSLLRRVAHWSWVRAPGVRAAFCGWHPRDLHPDVEQVGPRGSQRKSGGLQSFDFPSVRWPLGFDVWITRVGFSHQHLNPRTYRACNGYGADPNCKWRSVWYTETRGTAYAHGFIHICPLSESVTGTQ